jgi:hypothetical protein
MQELTKKLMEAGVIPAQSVALLKKWQALPDAMPEDVKLAQTQEELMRIVDEVAIILEKEDEMPELRETDLDIGYALKNAVDTYISVNAGLQQNLSCKCRMGLTRDHKFVFVVSDFNPARDEIFARRGNTITLPSGQRLLITGVEPRYQDKELKYYVLEVEKADA